MSKYLTTLIHNKKNAGSSRTIKRKTFPSILDWEKAFDKVDQEKLLEAMKRLGLPDKMLKVLASFYVNPQFRVKDREGKSSYRTQRAGIRQGCPLSPYFFICLMTVMFHDIHDEIDHKIGTMARLEQPLLNNWELIYADDTM